MTREPDFSGQTNKDWFTFYVLIGSLKTGQVQFYSDAHIMAYGQHDQSRCCLNSFNSALNAPKNWLPQMQPQHEYLPC